MILKEKETRRKLKAKGLLVKVDENGLHIEDEKTGGIDTLSVDDLKMFIGESINFSMSDVVKEDMDDK